MTRETVCAAGDLAPGERRLVTVAGTPIGVFNVDGELYAIENDCRHLHGPVCEGKVQGKLVAEYEGPVEGVREDFAEEPVVACPWHGWEYELATGAHVGEPTIALDTFPVAVEDGDVVVEVPDDR